MQKYKNQSMGAFIYKVFHTIVSTDLSPSFDAYVSSFLFYSQSNVSNTNKQHCVIRALVTNGHVQTSNVFNFYIWCISTHNAYVSHPAFPLLQLNKIAIFQMVPRRFSIIFFQKNVYFQFKLFSACISHYQRLRFVLINFTRILSIII